MTLISPAEGLWPFGDSDVISPEPFSNVDLISLSNPSLADGVILDKAPSGVSGETILDFALCFMPGLGDRDGGGLSGALMPDLAADAELLLSEA